MAVWQYGPCDGIGTPEIRENQYGVPGLCPSMASPDYARFDGPKPQYHVNPAHVRGPNFNPKKTPLPSDAQDVFRNAVPDSPTNPRNWYGKNADGSIYRFSSANDGTAHFSGRSDVGDGLRNMTKYAQQRLGGQ